MSVRAASADRAYGISEVAELTGLATDRLRVWERRYATVRPRRLPNGYRRYTSEQVALLRAYARLIALGARIGDLAARPTDDVLAEAHARAPDDSPHAALLDAMRVLDGDRLELLAAQELARRGLRDFAGEVVLPLARAVGDLWATGRLGVAAEHLASEVIVQTLKNALRPSRGTGPLVVVGCLPGERHEWGVLATMAVLQEDGWRVLYLGPDLPVGAMADASRTHSPRVVAFSGSNTTVVRTAIPALAALAAGLPAGTRLAIGGRGAGPYARTLRRHGFRIELDAFGRVAS